MNATLQYFADLLWRQSWQMVPVFILVLVLCRMLRNHSAHWRYLLWLAVLVKCVVPGTVPLSMSPEPPMTEAVQTTVSLEAPNPATASVMASGMETVTQLMNAVPVSRNDLGRWLGAIWAAGFVGSLFWAAGRAVRIERQLRRDRSEPDMEVECEFLELARQLGLRHRPRLRLIRGIGQPFVWGIWRGCIYLPEKFSNQGSAKQRHVILAHELAHVLRWDALANLLQVVIQSVFWFHPLVWWANREIRHEREKCCDEMAIAGLQVGSREYGNAIVDRLVDEFVPERPASSLAISGAAKDLEDRINTILHPGRRFHRRPGWVVLLLVLCFGGSAAAIHLGPLNRERNANHAVGATQFTRLPLPNDELLPLDQSWLPNAPQNHLAEFPAGSTRIDGVPFEVNGVLAMNKQDAARWSIERSIRRIHLLAGAAGTATEGEILAECVVHYENGDPSRLPIHYGEHLRDWWFWQFEPVSHAGSMTAWTGGNPAVRGQGGALRLYRVTFELPRPRDVVRAMEWIPHESASAVFVLGITVED